MAEPEPKHEYIKEHAELMIDELRSQQEKLQKQFNDFQKSAINQAQLDQKIGSVELYYQAQAASTEQALQQNIKALKTDISEQQHQEIDRLTLGANEFLEKFDLVKKEVDALQIEAMKPKIWYRDVPTLISLLAVVFSLSTAMASYLQVDNQNKLALRSELRSLIQRLTAMPAENVTLYKEYKDDAVTLNNLSSNLNTEYVLLAGQAVELTARIPNYISGPEYAAITQILLNQGVTEQVPALIEAGLKVSKDVNSHTALLRIQGTYNFSTGNLQEGRKDFQKAIDIVSKYSNNQYFIANSKIYTHIVWAQSAQGHGHCKEADALLEEARSVAQTLPAGNFTDTLKKQISSAQSYAKANPQACKA